MKTFRGVSGAALLTLTANALAQDGPADTSPFPQGWYVVPMATYMRADDQRCGVDNKTGVAAILGHRGDFASLEFWAQVLSLPMECTYTVPAPTMSDPNATATVNEKGDLELTGGGLGLLLGPFVEGGILSRFFGIVGFGLLEEKNVSFPLRDSTAIIGDAGLGYMHPFEVWGVRGALRTEARYRYDYQQPPRPANTPSTYNDVLFNLGVQIALSRQAESQAAETAQVVPLVVVDSDQDGVNDDRDQCPDTPPGSYVSNVGCPKPPEAAAPVVESPKVTTLQNAKAGDTIVLTGVTFESGRAVLQSNARTILDGVGRQLAARPELRIEIGGHTDSRGADSYNQSLSQQRAEAVQQYLAEQGVGAERLTAVGYGESEPVDTHDTGAGRARNRRIEMKVLE